MSENRSNKALFLIALFFVSVLSPLIPSSTADTTDGNDSDLNSNRPSARIDNDAPSPEGINDEKPQKMIDFL